jgi:hypothetical protein
MRATCSRSSYRSWFNHSTNPEAHHNANLSILLFLHLSLVQVFILLSIPFSNTLICVLPPKRKTAIQTYTFFPRGSTVLDRLTYRFLELFRHMVGLNAREISPLQGLYLHRATRHRKTRTNIHNLSRIRTHDPSNQPAKTHASDRTATVTGDSNLHKTVKIIDSCQIYILFSFHISACRGRWQACACYLYTQGHEAHVWNTQCSAL